MIQHFWQIELEPSFFLVEMIYRTCGPATATGCKSESVAAGISAEICHCDTDFCNGAGKPAMASAILISLTAFFLRF
jgi:hypothetical protein